MKNLLKSPPFYGVIYVILYFIGYLVLAHYNYTYFGIIKLVSIIIILITIVFSIISIYKTKKEAKIKLFTLYIFIEVVTVILLFLILGYFLGDRESVVTLYNKRLVESKSRFLAVIQFPIMTILILLLEEDIVRKKMHYDKEISKENYSMTEFFDDEGDLINYTYSQNIEEEIEVMDVKNGSYGSTTIENFLESIIEESRFNKTDIIRMRVIDSALAGKDIIVVEKSTDNGLSFKNILKNEDKYLIVNRDTDVTFVDEKIGFIFDLGLLGKDDRYKKFLVTTDGGESFSDVSITINGYGDLDYYYINYLPRFKKDKLVLTVSIPDGNDLKDIELVSNDDGLTFSN